MLVAVDTNVLLDQALEDADVLDALHVIRERKPEAQFIVTLTVLQELAWAVSHDDDAETREGALRALESLRAWGYQPIDVIPVGRGIVEQVSRKLRSCGALPEEEENDASIIGEAALCNCTMLLSSDWHLIDAQQHPRFREILSGADFDGDQLVIARPRTIANKLSRRR